MPATPAASGWKGAARHPARSSARRRPRGWERTFEEILHHQPERLALAHFGVVEGLEEVAEHVERARDYLRVWSAGSSAGWTRGSSSVAHATTTSSPKASTTTCAGRGRAVRAVVAWGWSATGGRSVSWPEPAGSGARGARGPGARPPRTEPARNVRLRLARLRVLQPRPQGRQRPSRHPAADGAGDTACALLGPPSSRVGGSARNQLPLPRRSRTLAVPDAVRLSLLRQRGGSGRRRRLFRGRDRECARPQRRARGPPPGRSSRRCRTRTSSTGSSAISSGLATISGNGPDMRSLTGAASSPTGGSGR